MDFLEGKELYNCSLSSLVTSPFVTQWSQDNHLSIITEKGIHIFELVPSPMTYGSSVKFSRSFVYPSDVLPTDTFTSQLNLMLWQWTRQEIYSFLLEETLIPRMNVITDLVPKVLFLAWSSQGMVHPSKCLLAMISSAGAVDILLKDDCEWFSACDIHSHWLRIVTEEFPDNNFGTLKSEQFKYYIRRLQAVAITWSQLYEESYSYFVVAYRSSDLLVWKIPAVIDHSREVIPTVALRTNLNLNTKIDLMEWIKIDRNKCLIVMTLFNGTIIGLIVDDIQGNVTSKQIEIYSEEDLVRISSIKCILFAEGEIRLVICKSTFLFIITIDSTGKILNNMYFQVPAFSITGFSMIDENQFLIYSQEGKLFLTKIENEEIQGRLIKTDLPKSYSQYLGLSHSYNKVLFATVTSPNTMYDHLVVREPSTFHIFSIDGEKFNPLEILKQNKTNSLLNYWDCFMVIGLKLIKNLITVNSIDKIPKHFESISVYELRVLMWLLVFADVYRRKKSLIDFSNVSDELLEIRSLITIYTSSSYLMAIGGKTQNSHEQRLCTRFLRTYLEIYIAGEEEELEMPVSQCADRALKFTCKVEVSGSEVCNLCKNVIVDLPWKTEKCPTGHKLPRCAITFLQITSVRYRSCPICKQIFHSSLDDEYPEGPKCLFCDIPVLHDSRVFGSVDRDRTNFSKRLSTRLKNAEQDEGGDDEPDDI
ncbi:uncharacterized protein LOC127278203 [Leptopilina boulardi]|uniref:uncharacterized protein LOC127278203 n=1 Tax=Leptopilina boulardi TaxID=63433 RepID=UPI0021F66648|nr:uncharacterized protein LOC127278203 [Leptopilina boulardi]